MITVSTITPVYAGDEFLPELVGRLQRVRDGWLARAAPVKLVEAIFVDDNSIDGSRDVLADLTREHPWVRLVELSSNFGQHRATVAGVLHSSGDWLVTLDEDLQHDPARIEEMLRLAVAERADVVYANAAGRVHGGSFRDFSSEATKRLVGALTGNGFVRYFNSFRLIRGSIGRAAASVCSYGTYFDVALCWFTTRIAVIRLPLKDVRYTEKGTSGYNIRKLASHARRLVVSSDTKVLRVAGGIGVLAILASVLAAVAVAGMKILDPSAVEVKGWTSLFLTLVFFGGLIAVQMGVALEFLSVLVLRAQGKPTFFVVDRAGDRVLQDYFTKHPTA